LTPSRAPVYDVRMSMINAYTIRCPKCGEEMDASLYDSVNIEQDPALRDELMNNTLNAITCESCGFMFRVDKRLLYHDPDRRIMVYWFPGDEQKYADGQAEFVAAMQALNQTLPDSFDPPTIHLVFHRVELVERILALEEGLNERILEYVKYQIYSRNPVKLNPEEKVLLFNPEDSTDTDLSFVVLDAHTMRLESALQFPRAAYDELEELFDQDEKTGHLLELFPGPYISARAVLKK